MVLNDKPNCQVSRILMNPRPILSDSSENHPKVSFFVLKIRSSSDKNAEGLFEKKNPSQLIQ
jgi:hypothetical protein